MHKHLLSNYEEVTILYYVYISTVIILIQKLPQVYPTLYLHPIKSNLVQFTYFQERITSHSAVIILNLNPPLRPHPRTAYAEIAKKSAEHTLFKFL